MSAGIPKRATAVWVALMAATAVTWWLGADHAATSDVGRVFVAMAIPVAFLKVHLIGWEFMEVHAAPTALKAIFSGWVTSLAAVLMALYLV